jgi:hypothetical protein
VSAASKVLFFGAAHLPIFIFDNLAGRALNLQRPISYRQWHERVVQEYRVLEVDHDEMRAQKPSGAPLDWFQRRCFDAMLVRIGRSSKDAASTSATP